MIAFLAYLARRKYELEKLIEEECECSLSLREYKGALQELIAVIDQLPTWNRDIVESLCRELPVILKEIKEDNHVHSIQP